MVTFLNSFTCAIDHQSIAKLSLNILITIFTRSWMVKKFQFQSCICNKLYAFKEALIKNSNWLMHNPSWFSSLAFYLYYQIQRLTYSKSFYVYLHMQLIQKQPVCTYFYSFHKTRIHWISRWYMFIVSK